MGTGKLKLLFMLRVVRKIKRVTTRSVGWALTCHLRNHETINGLAFYCRGNNFHISTAIVAKALSSSSMPFLTLTENSINLSCDNNRCRFVENLIIGKFSCAFLDLLWEFIWNMRHSLLVLIVEASRVGFRLVCKLIKDDFMSINIFISFARQVSVSVAAWDPRLALILYTLFSNLNESH